MGLHVALGAFVNDPALVVPAISRALEIRFSDQLTVVPIMSENALRFRT